MWVPLGLAASPGSVAEPVKLRCAVTVKFTTSVSVLLTPADYECLRRPWQKPMNHLKEGNAREISCLVQGIRPARYSSMREPEHVSQGSSSSANAVQHTVEKQDGRAKEPQTTKST